MELDVIERTVARLHGEEPLFDWVGVYLLEGEARPGYIGCDINTRSETVAPEEAAREIAEKA